MAYNAFISYSHTADAALAAALQSALDSFARPWYKLRALHIFRDQTNLAVNPVGLVFATPSINRCSSFCLLRLKLPPHPGLRRRPSIGSAKTEHRES
jgi:hypothetical protein